MQIKYTKKVIYEDRIDRKRWHFDITLKQEVECGTVNHFCGHKVKWQVCQTKMSFEIKIKLLHAYPI